MVQYGMRNFVFVFMNGSRLFFLGVFVYSMGYSMETVILQMYSMDSFVVLYMIIFQFFYTSGDMQGYFFFSQSIVIMLLYGMFG